MKQPLFKKELDEMRNKLFENAMIQLKVSASKAALTLIRLTDCEDSPNTQRAAANDILNHIAKFESLRGLENRIVFLEEHVQEKNMNLENRLKRLEVSLLKKYNDPEIENELKKWMKAHPNFIFLAQPESNEGVKIPEYLEETLSRVIHRLFNEKKLEPILCNFFKISDSLSTFLKSA